MIIKPAEKYEDLKTQFLELKKLLKDRDAQIELYRTRIKDFDFERVIYLQAQLDSVKEMNSILTKELERILHSNK